MKLYLSSYRIPTPDDLWALIGKQPAKIKAALIPNAKDYYAPRAWNFKVNESKDYLADLGMQVTVINLHDYKDPKTLKDVLERYDLLWVAGGNTFCLREAMKNSGFDQIVTDLIEHGIVYCGESAGAVLAGPNCKGVERADVPQFAETVIEEGLGIVPFSMIPHMDNPNYALGMVEMRKAQQELGHEVIELKDSQALVWSGTTHRIVEGALPSL